MSRLAFGFLVVAASVAAARPAGAETLPSAPAQAYRNNPQLNAERARGRAVDETVPQALSGYRPTVTVTADVGVQSLRQEASQSDIDGVTYPRGYGVTATQTLFNGFRTGNRTRAAESQVFAAREGLRRLKPEVLTLPVATYDPRLHYHQVRDAWIGVRPPDGR
ncbi:MAG: TolC family protein [Variibacter sp.]|nr:TolC family protein [Variibacter sp.]